MKEIALCAANAYQKKYYLNPSFNGLPASIRDELKIMCVLFTEDVGGILELFFTQDGSLEFRTACDEGDLLYDELGSGLKLKELQRTKTELFEGLELYVKLLTGSFTEEDV